MQHWEKTRNYFISIQPKTFHMLYKHNDLSIPMSLYQLHVELELRVHRNPSKMLLETCITQSFKYSTIYIYWILQWKRLKAFSSKNRNVPK